VQGFEFRVWGADPRIKELAKEEEPSDFSIRISGLWCDFDFQFSGFSGLGFRVWGLNFQFSSFNFRCSGFGFRFSGFSFRVFEFRVSVFGFKPESEGVRERGGAHQRLAQTFNVEPGLGFQSSEG